MRAKEGDMYCLNAPGFRGHFIILVKIEMPWLYFYDTVDKLYFITSYDDFKRGQKIIAHSPDNRHDLPYVDFVQTIPDVHWKPLTEYFAKAMKKKSPRHRKIVREL